MTEWFHEVRKGGVLLGVTDGALAREMSAALDAAGFVVKQVAAPGEVRWLVTSAAERSTRIELPEVLVLDETFLRSGETDLRAELEAQGMTDGLLVISSADWPDGFPQEEFDAVARLHSPFPMQLLVEEVAALASPVSMKPCPRRAAACVHA